MNRASLIAIEKRIAAAEIVARQGRVPMKVLIKPAVMLDVERSVWDAELAAAHKGADLVVIIQRFT